MGSENQLLKIYNYLKTCPNRFLGAECASFLLSSLGSFKGCWRSAAAAVHDLILVEVDGKCQFAVDNAQLI